MADKSIIQKILDKYQDFVKKFGCEGKEQEDFWKSMTTEEKHNLEEVHDAQKINTIFSIIEDADTIGQKGNINELNEQIDAFENTTIPLRAKGRFKLYYLKIAAVLLPIAIIFSSVFYFTNKYSSTNYQVISTEKGSKTKIILEDGTTVWLNAESELKYPSTFKNQEKRVVTLTGEAYFNVAINEKKPFEVYAAGYRFKVLGTAFNVKAYPGEEKIETTLEHGKVNVEKLTLGEGTEPLQVISLKPKQTIVLYKAPQKDVEIPEEVKTEDTKTDKPVDVDLIEKRPLLLENEDLSTYLAWKDNMLVFKDANISDMINDLERRYSIKIKIDDERIKGIKFTGTFTVETPEQAIKILCVAAKIGYKIDKDEVLLTFK